jgi:hypothetical protein
MTLIDGVKTVCRRLAPQGWADLRQRLVHGRFPGIFP